MRRCFILFVCLGVLLLLSCKGKNDVSLKDGDVFVAQTVEGVDLVFRIISVEEQTAQVGKGWEAALNETYDGNVTIPQEIEGFKIIRIAEGAFSKCGLSSVVIPEGVVTIQKSAFRGCRNLKRVIFPNSLTTIGNLAFVQTPLSSVFIPAAVSSIGNLAFSLGESTKVEVDPQNKFYDSRDGCNAIIETSANKLLFGCRETSFPKSIVEIGQYAFYDSSIVGDLVIPANIKIIGEEAFCFCKKITRIELSEGILEIRDKAFENTNITSVYIPKTVMAIGVNPFGRGIISRIRVDEKNDRYDSRGNCNAIIETATNTLVSGCKTTTIPEDITAIGECAMWYCDIEEVVFPECLRKVGDFSFASCNNLKKVTSRIKEPFEIPMYTFRSFSDSKQETILYVPLGTREKYASTKGWDVFADIVEIDL